MSGLFSFVSYENAFRTNNYKKMKTIFSDFWQLIDLWWDWESWVQIRKCDLWDTPSKALTQSCTFADTSSLSLSLMPHGYQMSNCTCTRSTTDINRPQWYRRRKYLSLDRRTYSWTPKRSSNFHTVGVFMSLEIEYVVVYIELHPQRLL